MNLLQCDAIMPSLILALHHSNIEGDMTQQYMRKYYMVETWLIDHAGTESTLTVTALSDLSSHYLQKNVETSYQSRIQTHYSSLIYNRYMARIGGITGL